MAKGQLKLLVIALGNLRPEDSLSLLGPSALPFMDHAREQWARAELRDPPQPEHLWPGLLTKPMALRGITAGLINLAWDAAPPAVEGFFIGRPATPGEVPLIRPAELADDLADYLPDPAPPKIAANRTLPSGQADLAYAEQAAVTRIRFEHARRLALEHGPRLLALSLGGVGLTISLFGPQAGRSLVFLRQIDYYLAQLHHDLAPRAMALIGNTGLVMVQGPGLEPSSDLGLMSPAACSGLLASLIQGSEA